MSRRATFVLAAAVAATCAAATVIAKQREPRVTTESLLTVIAPVHMGVENAHPWINVRVRFGTASDGSAADPETFKARLGSCRLPDEIFEDVEEGGAVVEKRARVTSETTRCRFKRGEQNRNRLKLKVSASGASRKQRKLKDIDKARFGIVERGNRPPEPQLSIDTDVIRPGVDVTFSAVQSHDPDGDWLTYEWDFGDPEHSTAAGETVTHRYTADLPATVMLSASDGQESAVAQRTLPALPTLDPGRTEGILALSASSETTLDFGAVPVGQSDTRTFTVHNDASGVASSQVKFTVEALGGGGAFTVDCAPTVEVCDLGPGEEREITVTFAPAAEAEHTEAVLQLLATASNQSRIDLLVHGYGTGAQAPQHVPWNTAGTAFYVVSSSGVLATKPDGTAVTLDTGTGTCLGGSLGGAPCIGDGDCPGASCGERRCSGGTNPGSVCSDVSDCPSGSCGVPFDPIDLCADGTGSVFLLNDLAGVDPDPDRDPPQTGVILRAGLDGNRSIVTDAVTEESLALACDRLPGGKAFWTQYDVYGDDWDERDQLMSIGKDGTSKDPLVADICELLSNKYGDDYKDPSDGYLYYEQSTGLRATADGRTVYVMNGIGLYRLYRYRLDPDPLLITYELRDEPFNLFPDGSILAASIAEDSTRSTIRVYKIDPNNAINGPLALADLTPWATMSIPNNLGPCSGSCPHVTYINAMAVDPDGIVFINVRSTISEGVVPDQLRTKGTARFEPQQDGTSGIYTGFVNLATLNLLSF